MFLRGRFYKVNLYIIQASIGKDLGFGKYFSEKQLKWYEEIDNLNDFYETIL